MYKYQMSTTILRGFPVRVSFNTIDADPSVGIYNKGIDDLQILTEKGKSAEWLTKQMKERDWEILKDECARFSKDITDHYIAEYSYYEKDTKEKNKT